MRSHICMQIKYLDTVLEIYFFSDPSCNHSVHFGRLPCCTHAANPASDKSLWSPKKHMLNLPHSQHSKYNVFLILHFFFFFWSEYKKQSDLIGELITCERRAMKLSITKGPFFQPLKSLVSLYTFIHCWKWFCNYFERVILGGMWNYFNRKTHMRKHSM